MYISPLISCFIDSSDATLRRRSLKKTRDDHINSMSDKLKKHVDNFNRTNSVSGDSADDLVSVNRLHTQTHVNTHDTFVTINRHDRGIRLA